NSSSVAWTKVEADETVLCVDPGGEFAEPGLDHAPTICFAIHAASLRLAQRCTVARLRCGENASIMRAVSSCLGLCSNACTRCNAAASAASPTGALSAKPLRNMT